MARQSSGRASTATDLLLKDSLGSRQARVSEVGLQIRGINPLSPSNSPTAKASPPFSSRLACSRAFAMSSSPILSFLRPPSLRSWIRRLGVPASSSANSTRVPSCRAQQREQQFAQAFSSRNGQMSTGPSSGSRTLKNAGRDVGPVRTTGTQSSMMIYFHTLSWQMRRRQTPKALTPCPSKILARSCGLPARQFIAPARYSCAQLPTGTITSARRWPARVRARPLKTSGRRIQVISSPIFSLPFLAAKTLEATGGKISSLYLKGLATGCLGSVRQVAAEKRLLRVEALPWDSAWRRATMERYFCLMILLVLLSLSCLSALPRPDATEQERSRSLDPSRLRLRIVRPFLRMEGLRSFSFRRIASPSLPSITPPNRTSFGISGHSDCLLSSVLISSSRFSRSHSGSVGALSTATIRSPSLLFRAAVLQILCSREAYLGRGQQSLLVASSRPSTSSLRGLVCAFLRCNLQLRLPDLPAESSRLRSSLSGGEGLSAAGGRACGCGERYPWAASGRSGSGGNLFRRSITWAGNKFKHHTDFSEQPRDSGKGGLHWRGGGEREDS